MKITTSKSLLTISVVAISLLTAAATSQKAAQAQTLDNGSKIVPTQTFTASDLGTLVTEQSVLGNSSFAGLTLDFEARSAVYRNSDGTLDFLYQIYNNGGSTDQIGRFTVAIYPEDVTSNIFYAAGLDVDGAGVFTAGNEVPDFVGRDYDGSPIGFDFLASAGGRLRAGETTSVMLVRTNATEFQLGPMAVIDGATAVVSTYAPKSPGSSSSAGGSAVPEPGTIALLGTGLLGMVGIAASRRRK